MCIGSLYFVTLVVMLVDIIPVGSRTDLRENQALRQSSLNYD
jgi:hypothetical protein